MYRPLTFLFCVATLPLTFWFTQDQDTDEKRDDSKIEIPARDENTIARRDFMRTKLMYSQNIFHGLTIGDFELIKSGIHEVGSTTKAEQWVAINDVRFQKLTDDFETSVRRLRTAADSGNIEATALRFYEMSTSCIDCHQHIRKVEYEL